METNKIENISDILEKQFDIICRDIAEINIGLSAAENYKVQSDDKAFFLKIYDKKKSQFSLWTENINIYMPVLIWLYENTNLCGRIVCPLKTNKGDYRFNDEEENVYLLFDYIDGEAIEINSLTNSQITEAAEIIACLNNYSIDILESSVNAAGAEKIKEDFSVPFCYLLENFIANEYQTSPVDVKVAIQPYLEQLKFKNDELKLLAAKVKYKPVKMVLCHTDAHYKNFMQKNGHLILVDWEGMKLAPAEADLFMFTQKKYWDIFIKNYGELRSDFILDNEMLSFYILRRKIEDIWVFIESTLYDNLSDLQRKRDLAFLVNGCGRLEEFSFEL